MRSATKEISGVKKGAAKRVTAGATAKAKGIVKTGRASAGRAAVAAHESTGIGRKAKSRKSGSSK